MEARGGVSTPRTLLLLLLRQRHWQPYNTFRREYDKAASRIDERLVGTWPSRAQFNRWVYGQLKELPYADHCRVLEEMLPGWTVDQLFGPPTSDASPSPEGEGVSSKRPEHLRLVTSGPELQTALIEVVRGAREFLVAVGSRSREPKYLREIEDALERSPDLTHYRILIGPPHSQIMKDHMHRLLELRDARTKHRSRRKTLYMSMLDDVISDAERFFVASERAAVVMLPSANSPANFDTGLIVRDISYIQGLVQHGRALYGKRRLETTEAIDELVVLR